MAFIQTEGTTRSLASWNKVQGGSHWTDSSGRDFLDSFKLGPGDLLVAGRMARRE